MHRPASFPCRMALQLLLAAALSALWPAIGIAQQPQPQTQLPSVEEIVRKLTQPRIAPQDLANSAVAVEGQRKRAEAPASIDLAVHFEFASARLSPDARILLDNLGQALDDPALRQARFHIAGHTDARGGDAYNLALSRRRAQSVVAYLVRQHGIDARRLRAEGFGRSQLLNPDQPDSVVNRRVQITNLGP